MKLKVAIILVTLLLVLVWADNAQAGLGISPSRWVEKNALKGSHLEKVFTLSRSNPVVDLSFKAEIKGEIKDWIKIDKGLDFTIPRGQQQFPIKVILDVPQEADYRDYQGSIRLKSESKDAETSGMGAGVVLSSLIQIDLTVSEKEILEYEILQIAIPDSEAGEPVSIYLKIWNTGNVEAKPTKVTVDFFDKFKKINLGSYEVIDFSGVPSVEPFSEGEIKIDIPAKFEAEQYWASIKVYQEAELLKSEDITFEVKEVGSFEKAKKRVLPIKEEERTKSFPYLYLYFGAGAILLAVLIFLSWRNWGKIKGPFRKTRKSSLVSQTLKKVAKVKKRGLKSVSPQKKTIDLRRKKGKQKKKNKK